jgi:hypothetical protein
MSVKIKVLLDVHHFLPKSLVKLRGRFDRNAQFSKLNPAEYHKAFAHIQATDHAGGFLRFAAQFGTRQPFQLVFTAHHEFCVRNILAENDWSAAQIDFFVKACKALAVHTGGGFENIDYMKAQKTNPDLKFELAAMGGTHRTPDLEDASIVKMAVDLKCDVIVSNDSGVLAARVDTSLRSIEAFTTEINQAMRSRIAA